MDLIFQKSRHLRMIINDNSEATKDDEIPESSPTVTIETMKKQERQRNSRLFQSLKQTLSTRAKEVPSNTRQEIHDKIQQRLHQESLKAKEMTEKQRDAKKDSTEFKRTKYEPSITYKLNN